jgi:hypothetical protein
MRSHHFLLLCFLSLCMVMLSPAQAKACDYLKNADGPLGNMLNLAGDAFELAEPVVQTMGKSSKALSHAGPIANRLNGMLAACNGIENFNACMSDGFPNATCAQQALPDALCAISEGLGVNPRNPFSAAALVVPPMCVMSAAYDIAMQPDNPLCEIPPLPDNGGDLCCCKYPGEPICHTGFCPSGTGIPPANCPTSLGPVDAQTGTCDQIAACGGEDPEPAEAADAQALQNAINTVSGSFKSYLDVNYTRASDGLNDQAEPSLNSEVCNRQKLFELATFKGCRGFDPIMKQAEPYIDAAQWTSPPTSQAQTRTLYELLGTNVAWRLIQGIPNGVQRYMNAVGGNGDPFRTGSPPAGYSTQSWIDHQIATKGIDPEQELQKWLSPCAIEILKNGLSANKWKLLAIDSGNTQTIVQEDPDTVEDGCYEGESPTITSLTQAAQDKTLTLTLVVTDPEYSDGHAPNSNIEAVIAWGEEDENGNVAQIVSYNLTHGISGQSYAHTYQTKGDYKIKVYVMNSVGKVANASLDTNFNPVSDNSKTKSGTKSSGSKTLSLPSY